MKFKKEREIEKLKEEEREKKKEKKNFLNFIQGYW